MKPLGHQNSLRRHAILALGMKIKFRVGKVLSGTLPIAITISAFLAPLSLGINAENSIVMLTPFRLSALFCVSKHMKTTGEFWIIDSWDLHKKIKLTVFHLSADVKCCITV